MTFLAQNLLYPLYYNVYIIYEFSPNSVVSVWCSSITQCFLFILPPIIPNPVEHLTIPSPVPDPVEHLTIPSPVPDPLRRLSILSPDSPTADQLFVNLPRRYSSPKLNVELNFTIFFHIRVCIFLSAIQTQR